MGYPGWHSRLSMSTQEFLTAWEDLSPIQREAAEWDDEPLLLLAGPGSGKTRVLTCRIARILDSSRDKNFRILGLTFTNKAADEMRGRVAAFVPGQEGRLFWVLFIHSVPMSCASMAHTWVSTQTSKYTRKKLTCWLC